MERITIVLVGLVVMAGCKQQGDDFRQLPDISQINQSVVIDRLDQQMAELATPEDLAYWLWDNPVVADLFWDRTSYARPADPLARPNDDSEMILDSVAYVETVWNVLKDSTFRAAIIDPTLRQFADLSEMEESLTLAFRRIKAYDPAFEFPRVQVVISSLFRDIYVGEDVWIIGLENFLGPTAPYRPTGPGGQPLPVYLMRRYQQEYIVPMLLKSCAQRYLGQDPNARLHLLDEMLTYGKLYEFTKSVLPELPDSLIVRYSGAELAGVEANEAYIWGHFIENELLYNTNFIEYRPYIDEAPAVPAIGSSCPGRVGRYVGWQILKSYRRKQAVGIMELMRTVNSERILQEANYRP